MTDEAVPDRVARAFRDHGSFEPRKEATYDFVTTAFDGTVGVAPATDGSVEFTVTVGVPMLSAVVDGDVADVVEEGWYETFERRIEDVGGLTRADHDLSPTVRRAGTDARVEVSFEDVDERRGVDDAGAVINYVEGTYVQGIIPGYEYREPVSGLIDRARNGSGV